MCGVHDTMMQCVWELIMQYDAVLQRSLHGYRLQVAPLREGTVYCEQEACAAWRGCSSLTGRSPLTDREVGEGAAQRLLTRGGHVVAGVEVKGGESGEACQIEQPLVRGVVTVP